MTSDPLRTDATASTNASSGVERDAKIEQLLLAGLDHYFASQYDQAINVWTRALFIDRNHARARAYIERARRAQAERQRESEELLHNGAAAYRRGDGREARRLLQAALDAGAPVEDTFPILERLNQLEAATVPQPVARARVVSHSPTRSVVDSGGQQSRAWRALGFALLVVVAVGVYVVVSSRGEWGPLTSLAGGRAPTTAPPVRETALALPTNGEMVLASARSLASHGDLRAALSMLEHVRLTDQQRAEADRLRADVQRLLLRSVSDGLTGPAGRDSGAEPRR
jgi:hypothetical protein